MSRGLRGFKITVTISLLMLSLPESHAFRANIAFWKKAAPTGYDCLNETPPIGAICIGGAIYAGIFNGKKYMVGGTGSLSFTWGSWVVHGTTSTTDGKANTTTLANGWSDTNAAKHCEDMVYGGYSDWFLPAKDELNHLYQNRDALGVFINAYYWSSTEYSESNAWAQSFLPGGHP